MTPDHTHCWHWTGDTLASNPVQYPVVCCHCEERQNLKALPAQARTPRVHGPHVEMLAIKQRMSFLAADLA